MGIGVIRRHHKLLFCWLLLAVTAFSGCRTMRSATNADNITAARSLTLDGMNAMHYGRPEQAETLLSMAVEQCPCDQRIRHHLATSMVKQGKLDEAIQQLEIAVDQTCQDPRLFVELGNLYLGKGDLQQATENAETALDLGRQNPSAWILLGRCQEARGDFQAALASFHRAAGFDEADPIVQLEIAKVYRSLERPLEALTALEVYGEALPSDQLSSEALLLTAATLTELKQYQSASQCLSQAAARPDATPEVWMALSKSFYNAGDSNMALGTAQQALRAFPNDSALADWMVNLERMDPSLKQTAAREVPRRF